MPDDTAGGARPTRRGALAPLAPLTALAALALACGDPALPAAPEPADPPGAFAAAPAVRDALGDAAARLVPALDAGLRAALAPPLGELRAAVDAGQARRAAAAVRAVRALLAEHVPGPVDGPGHGDAADVAALAVLTDVVADVVAASASPRDGR